MTKTNPLYSLYTSPTPNGYKISIMLEELNVSYKVHPIQLHQLEQKQEWYTKLNPNGRIPVLIDHTKDDFPIFETGAILTYLGEKHEKFLPKDTKEKSKVMQWVFFQHGGIGPMQGQAHVFLHYAPEKIPFAIQRYQNETRRLYEVLERQLNSHNGPYLLGDTYTIADIATFPWVAIHKYAEISLSGLSKVEEWINHIKKRPAVQRGLEIPISRHELKENVQKMGKLLIDKQ